MSARVAEARRLLREAQFESPGKPLYASETDTLAAAQVEATLALVEQQRLANLIALVDYDSLIEVGVQREISEELVEQVPGEDGFSSPRLRPQLARLLGLAVKRSE